MIIKIDKDMSGVEKASIALRLFAVAVGIKSIYDFCDHEYEIHSEHCGNELWDECKHCGHQITYDG